MVKWVRIRNHPRGLVYIGRSFSYSKKIEPIEKTQPTNNLEDAKFRYYYYLYIKKEDKT